MRRIFISFFLSILLLKYASSTDSECTTKTAAEKGDTECSEFETSDNDHYCTDNVAGAALPCKEADACNLLEPDGTITEGDGCAQRPLHKAGNICKTITVDGNDICHEYSPCMTTEDLTAAGKENCAGLEAQDNYLCVEANNNNGLNDGKPCIEVKTCNLLPPKTDGDGDRCDGYTTLKQGNHCKEITVNSEKKCKEVPACQGATPNPISYENCKDLWVDDTNKKKCVAKEDNSACTVATKCDDVKIGATADLCNFFSTDKEKCVVDGNECKPKTICGQETYEKGTTNCRDSVPDDNKVCADTGNGCESQTPCEGVTYKDGTDCTKLPTVDTNKICRKHQTDGKCVEVTEPDDDGEADTKTTGEADTKTTGEADTKTTGETDTKTTGETVPTQGTETDLNKDNKGMLLNLSLYTLLIYFLF